MAHAPALSGLPLARRQIADGFTTAAKESGREHLSFSEVQAMLGVFDAMDLISSPMLPAAPAAKVGTDADRIIAEITRGERG